jgi:hypothetical protein
MLRLEDAFTPAIAHTREASGVRKRSWPHAKSRRAASLIAFLSLERMIIHSHPTCDETWASVCEAGSQAFAPQIRPLLPMHLILCPLGLSP